ncbi:VOC family protein [Streptomyces sp. NPDC052077]|uniref:bleomycin resistance protein n=1 Tax=Streptomyces sp. NPDC052077 TaxID=3154757 RepID=UPI0034431ECE
MSETTIPILPCRTIQPVLDFYTTLGFTVTFRQQSPNPYAVVERGGIQLHFFALKRYEPTESHSTCYVLTDDVDGLHDAFRARLKEAYGRIPTRGLPRIGPLRDTSYGMRQFLVTDPGGNCLRIGERTSREQHHRPAPGGPVSRALHHASLLADSKEDPESAARVLDRILGAADERPTPAQSLRLLVLRADVAGRLGDEETARSALARAAAIRLTGRERESARDDLERLAELKD